MLKTEKHQKRNSKMRLEMSNQNDNLYSYANGCLNLDGIRNLCSASVNMGRVLEQRYEKKKEKQKNAPCARAAFE